MEINTIVTRLLILVDPGVVPQIIIVQHFSVRDTCPLLWGVLFGYRTKSQCSNAWIEFVFTYRFGSRQTFTYIVIYYWLAIKYIFYFWSAIYEYFFTKIFSIENGIVRKLHFFRHSLSMNPTSLTKQYRRLWCVLNATKRCYTYYLSFSVWSKLKSHCMSGSRVATQWDAPMVWEDLLKLQSTFGIKLCLGHGHKKLFLSHDHWLWSWGMIVEGYLTILGNGHKDKTAVLWP